MVNDGTSKVNPGGDYAMKLVLTAERRLAPAQSHKVNSLAEAYTLTKKWVDEHCLSSRYQVKRAHVFCRGKAVAFVDPLVGKVFRAHPITLVSIPDEVLLDWTEYSKELDAQTTKVNAKNALFERSSQKRSEMWKTFFDGVSEILCALPHVQSNMREKLSTIDGTTFRIDVRFFTTSKYVSDACIFVGFNSESGTIELNTSFSSQTESQFNEHGCDLFAFQQEVWTATIMLRAKLRDEKLQAIFTDIRALREQLAKFS